MITEHSDQEDWTETDRFLWVAANEGEELINEDDVGRFIPLLPPHHSLQELGWVLLVGLSLPATQTT